MPTLFIAVQCFQCSTMQVKQQKKRSNKWVCVVCNQRQSVRRIHAQGPLARDLRHFVQAFNTSRSDGPHPIPPPSEGSRSPMAAAEHRGGANRGKRRMDWTEYLDLQENKGEGGGGDSIGSKGGGISVAMKGRSRWSEYLEEFDGCSQGEEFSNPTGGLEPWGGRENLLPDMRVEEEVHPDFQ
uniref:Uncharacterized protein LOC105051257 isoform X2 n=1 Tax=Elaeis guineensis var. tenera TaxID=51953 RepID=A0A6J0PM23_ELAGV|nr:uncharacterized protein LOC105051257 isoform X2 [Elaeis guineensis]